MNFLNRLCIMFMHLCSFVVQLLVKLTKGELHADCVYHSAIYMFRFNVDMSDFPTIHRVNEECIKLDSFKAAVPTAQPDCPADLKG